MNLNRRTFLASIAATAILGDKLGAAIQNSNKSLIWIWLGGGISCTEFYNPIPDAPEEYRSVTGAIGTNSNYMLGGNFTKLATIANKLSPVLSFSHKDSTHHSATHNVMTGYPTLLGSQPGAAQKDPSYGSLISKLTCYCSQQGIPAYVKINPIEYDSSVWVGANHVGYEANGEGVKTLKPNIELDRFRRRLDMVKGFERGSSDWSDLRTQAFDIVSGQASKAFDITQEPESLVKYNSPFGKNLLLARRLVEAGAKFITLHHGGWDMHASIKTGFDGLGPDVDYSIFTLLNDLEAKGLLNDTLVVISSEFSRTPKLNQGLAGISDIPGRDHWSAVSPLVLAGGKYLNKGIIGTTNKNAEYPTSKIYGPNDLMYTIFDHFELDTHTVLHDNSGRPRYLVPENSVIIA